MSFNWGHVGTPLDCGCPQGSKVGPVWWKLYMPGYLLTGDKLVNRWTADARRGARLVTWNGSEFNDFIRQDWLTGVQVVAYADEAALITNAGSRARDGRKQMLRADGHNGGERHGLTFCTEKTVALQLRDPRKKRKLDEFRSPII